MGVKETLSPLQGKELPSTISQRCDLPEPEQRRICSDEGQIQHLSGRSKKAICGVLMGKLQLPGSKRDLVRYRSLVKRRSGIGYPFRYISTQPNSALGIQS